MYFKKEIFSEKVKYFTIYFYNSWFNIFDRIY